MSVREVNESDRIYVWGSNQGETWKYVWSCESWYLLVCRVRNDLKRSWIVERFGVG